jgi:formamidopyrimidine-DNA glycosylase
VPELPEVETTRRGIAPLLTGLNLRGLVVHEPRLRWPVDPELPARLRGRTLQAIHRRGKYLLLDWGDETLLLHLGMSGSLRVLTRPAPRRPHDHLEFDFGDGRRLVFHDPRRFGSALLVGGDPDRHPLLRHLGPEPLTTAFDGAHLHRQAAGRRAPVKAFLMDGKVVVGVGNIYAAEALHLAGIHPGRPAGRVSLARYQRLATHVKQVLDDAITEGGTTLRDFVNGQGEPGYFAARWGCAN